jgi:hypothetical protein
MKHDKMSYVEFKEHASKEENINKRMKITDSHFMTNAERQELFLDNLNPLEKFDKIEFVSPHEVEDLLSWRDNNKDLVRKHNFPLEQGVIDSVFNDVKIIFQKQGNEVYLDCVMKRNGTYSHFLTFYWIYEKMQIQIIHPEKKLMEENNDFYTGQAQSMITVFASLMAYMEHFQEHRELVQKKTISNTKVKKKKNGKKKTIRKANKVVYNISVVNEMPKQKREYSIDETKSWTVKGHWRHYKDGSKTWVKPYKKGNVDGEEEPATYRL